MKTLYFITSNKGKVREAADKLRPFDITVVQKDLGYAEVQADSLREVAAQGVKEVQKRFDQPFMLEDSGIFIMGLKGFPGVYSKYVFFTIGLPGILRLLEREKNRSAVFQSVYAYCEPKRKPIIVSGECPGVITFDQRGKNGFGFDPIFIPIGAKKTFGEMTTKEKNQFSHRSKALENLISKLKKF